MKTNVFKTLLVTTALATASVAALPAVAQTATDAAPETSERPLENAAESTEQALENTGTAIENTAENAAEATGEAMDDAGTMAENAAESTGEAIEHGADATGQAIENAADSVEDGTADMAADTDPEADPMDVPEGYEAAQVDELTTEDVTGTSVFDSADNNIGEVDELIVTEDGKIEAAIIDVGGFLGIGEHSVRIGMDKVQMLRDGETGDLRVRVNESRETLEAMPEYEG